LRNLRRLIKTAQVIPDSRRIGGKITKTPDSTVGFLIAIPATMKEALNGSAGPEPVMIRHFEGIGKLLWGAIPAKKGLVEQALFW
jgi:hypothetical protein